MTTPPANGPKADDGIRVEAFEASASERAVRFDPKVADRDLIHEHSRDWANIVQPFTYCFLAILALVMFLPFLFVWYSPEPNIKLPEGTALTPELLSAAVGAASAEHARAALDWAKTILPSAVGFGSAIVGYYFGTRNSSRESSQVRKQP